MLVCILTIKMSILIVSGLHNLIPIYCEKNQMCTNFLFFISLVNLNKQRSLEYMWDVAHRVVLGIKWHDVEMHTFQKMLEKALRTHGRCCLPCLSQETGTRLNENNKYERKLVIKSTDDNESGKGEHLFRPHNVLHSVLNA